MPSSRASMSANYNNLPRETQDRLLNILRAVGGVNPSLVAPSSSLQGMGLRGLDLHEFLEGFSREFAVDMSAYRWQYHTEPDGFNPLWVVSSPWGSRVEKVPITMDMLAAAIDDGKWFGEYGGAEPPSGLHAADLALLVCIVVLLIWWVVSRFGVR